MFKHLATITLLFLAAVTLSVCSAIAQEDTFETGNKYYEQGDFDNAIKMYTKVMGTGVESAALYYNLGNAYFKKGDLGRAILYYHRARRIDPADLDIKNNLEFAAQFPKVRMEGVELNPIRTFLNSLVGEYKLNTLGWISSLLFVLFIGLLIAKYGLQFLFPGINAAIIAALVILLISTGLTTFKYRTDYLDRRAVIISDDSNVYSGPSTNSDLEFEGSPGLVVDILSEAGEYYNVLFENKRRGWIKKSLVAEI